MQPKLKVFLLNCSGWAALISYDTWMLYKLHSPYPWYQYVAFLLLNGFFFYAVLFSFMRIAKKNTVLVGLLLLTVILYGFQILSGEILSLLYRFEFGKTHIKTESDSALITYREVTFFIYALCSFLAIQILEISRKADRLEISRLKETHEKKQIESDLVISQNAFLRAQINKHLLFNTLNYIYNEADKYSQNASKAVGLLGDILHFGLKKSDADEKVIISDEVEQADKLIELQQLKFHNALHINFEKDIESRCGENRIIPLVILTFIENIFEHGDLQSPNFPALIQIICRDNQLNLVTQNRKRTSRLQQGHGIGIHNVVTRLKYQYPPSSYELDIRNEEQQYTVNFKLNL